MRYQAFEGVQDAGWQVQRYDRAGSLARAGGQAYPVLDRRAADALDAEEHAITLALATPRDQPGPVAEAHRLLEAEAAVAVLQVFAKT